MEIPPPSAEAIARGLLAAEPGATRLSIGAETQRAWARKRVRAAWGALPLFVALGVGALVVSTSLTLIAVICGFMVYACVSLAGQADRELRTASDRELVLIGAQLRGVGALSEAIFRREYVRLLVAGSGAADVPLTGPQREELRAALAAAGVPTTVEGPVRRVLVVAGAIGVALLGVVLVKVALGLAVVLTLAEAPVYAGVILAVVGAAWLLRRASGR